MFFYDFGSFSPNRAPARGVLHKVFRAISTLYPRILVAGCRCRCVPELCPAASLHILTGRPQDSRCRLPSPRARCRLPSPRPRCRLPSPRARCQLPSPDPVAGCRAQIPWLVAEPRSQSSEHNVQKCSFAVFAGTIHNAQCTSTMHNAECTRHNIR